MKKIIIIATLLIVSLASHAQSWLNVGNTLQRQSNGTYSNYRFNMGSPGFSYFYSKPQVDSVISHGATYTAGYGLGLTAFQFRLDSTIAVNKNYFNTVIGTATLNRLGNGYVPYTGAVTDLDLLSTGRQVFAAGGEFGNVSGGFPGFYTINIYNESATGKGVYIAAGGATGIALGISPYNFGSETIQLFGDGHGIFSNSLTSSAFIKTGGTSSQFLKADGSVDGTSYAPSGGGALTYTHIMGYGFLGGNFNNTANITSMLDTSIVVTKTFANRYPLKSTTIAGFDLRNNITLASLTPNYGLVGSAYNASSAQGWRVDTASLLTINNFFPKGDARWLKKADTASLSNRINFKADTAIISTKILDSLKTFAANTLTANHGAFTNTGYEYWKAANTSGAYTYSWVIDTWFAMTATPESFTATQVKNNFLQWMGKDSLNNIPIAVAGDGTHALYNTGGTVNTFHLQADGATYMPLFMRLYYSKSSDITVFNTYAAQLKAALDGIPLDATTHLVNIPSATPWTPWGFHDHLANTGNDLMGSLTYYKACIDMAYLYGIAGDATNQADFANRAALIVSNLPSLWDSADGMFYSASIQNRQPDVQGSAFAIYLGIVSTAKADSISNYIINNLSSLAYTGYIKETNGDWAYTNGATHGNLGNGAWSYGNEWVIATIARKSVPKAIALAIDFYLNTDKSQEVYGLTVNGSTAMLEAPMGTLAWVKNSGLFPFLSTVVRAKQNGLNMVGAPLVVTSPGQIGQGPVQWTNNGYTVQHAQGNTESLTFSGLNGGQINFKGSGESQLTWYAQTNAVTLGTSGALTSNTVGINTALWANAYTNTAGVTKYVLNGLATNLTLSANGTFDFYTAPTGTAGNTATFTKVASISNTGGLTATTGSFSGNVTVGNQSGATATPNKITLTNDFSNGTTSDKLKLYLYDGGSSLTRYGFTVGNSSEIQYHTGNGPHDFYINNTKAWSLGASLSTFNGTLSGNGIFKITGTSIGAATDRWFGSNGSTGTYINTPSATAVKIGVNLTDILVVSSTGATITGTLGVSSFATGTTGTDAILVNHGGIIGSIAANSYLTPSSASSTYLPLTGGTLTGPLTTSGTNGGTFGGTLKSSGFENATATFGAGSTTPNGFNYTIQGNAASGSVTVALPAAGTYIGIIYIIKKIDSSANTVSITANGSETIDGVATKTISTQYSGYTIQSTGSSWIIIGSF